MKLATAFFVISLSLCLAGATPYGGRVIDGSVVEGSVPYIVSITVNTLHICGGFIYSPGWVVTAASCVYQRQTTPLKVVVNEGSLISIDPDEVAIAVYQIFIKEDFDPTTKANDLALLKLASNATYPATCLRYDEVLPSFGTTGWLVGWGSNIEFNGTASARPHNATLEVLERLCNGNADPTFDADTMLCANSTETAPSVEAVPCTHDEGAPLVMQTMDLEPVAVGIFSKNDMCITNSPNIFTRLSAFYSWLINTAGRQPTDCFKPAS